MKQEDFLKEEEIHTVDKEILLRRALAENNTLKEEISGLKEENSELREQLAYLKKIVYGRKSEKTEVIMENGEQLSIFNEAEQEAEVSPKAAQATVEVKSHQRKKRTRDELMADLQVVEVLHPVENKTCERCGAEMTVISKQKIRDELVYVPARLYLRRHVAEVVKCTCCGQNADHDEKLPDIEPCHICRAEVPRPMIPRSFCSPELLAHIVYEKYCNALPLYRLERDFAEKGAQLSRTTMANWVIYAAEMWVKPVWKYMHSELLSYEVVHGDETVVKVLHEDGRKAKSLSRMWVYCNGKASDHTIILFDYQPTRNGDHAAKFLKGYEHYLVCDGYDGYNKLKTAKRCGCWAHVRRKFVEALPAEKELLPGSAAAKGVEYCNRLYQLEKAFADLTPEERARERRTKSEPLLNAFFSWLDNIVVSGGSKLAKAVSYARSERKYLCRFLESPDIPIDNNRAENAIRPFVIGRKNWLFSASVKGAEASAMIYSVAATACANGLNMEDYFVRLFSQSPGTLVLPW